MLSNEPIVDQAYAHIVNYAILHQAYSKMNIAKREQINSMVNLLLDEVGGHDKRFALKEIVNLFSEMFDKN